MILLAELKTAQTGAYQFVGDGEMDVQDGTIFFYDGEKIKISGDHKSINLKDLNAHFSDFSLVNKIFP